MKENDVIAPDPDACLATAFSVWEKPRLYAACVALERLRDAASEDGALVSEAAVGRIRRGWGLERIVVREDPAALAEIASRTGLIVRPEKPRGKIRPRVAVLGPVDDPSIK